MAEDNAQPGEDKIPFCWHARRWLIHAIDPRSCPYIGTWGVTYCIGDKCGYYEEREPTKYVLNLLELLREG